MSKVANDISSRFENYLDLLSTLCSVYDDGREIVALSISAAIRVLVHDTKQSTSLITHAGKFDRQFISTRITEQDDEKVYLGLVRIIHVGVHDGIGGEAKYWPLCDERYFRSPSDNSAVSFHQWWNEEHVFKSHDSALTRRDLVLAVANKDGGAHFDSLVEKRYDDFRHSWTVPPKVQGLYSGVIRTYDNIPIYPAIRQIGHELIQTFSAK